ncbi:NADH-quinone oxidoreductase subunit J [Persicobacter psychrovividus]|uniref:NADH-quinone oxidoreductase subunit J n=1 Tax=Persicobacter psychrovividus TaxID=387638 RepID=A0ABM7VE94_9BACT|nr:NADH-quinone oxidoreductase subunit J [Persicobacter psychrovividus]
MNQYLIYEILFYGFMGLTLLSAITIIFAKNVLYAAFSLLVSLFGVAALFVLMGADFLGIAQIMIYIGGILVLMIFGVMLTNRLNGKPIITANKNVLVSLILGMVTFGFLGLVFSQFEWAKRPWMQADAVADGSIRALGIATMTNFILPFELVAVMLLVALIAGTYLAKRAR